MSERERERERGNKRIQVIDELSMWKATMTLDPEGARVQYHNN